MEIAVLEKQDRNRIESAVQDAVVSVDTDYTTTIDDGGLRISVSSDECETGIRLVVSVTLVEPGRYLPENMIGFPEYLDGLTYPCPALDEELVVIIYDALDGQVGYFDYNSNSPYTAPEYTFETTFPR